MFSPIKVVMKKGCVKYKLSSFTWAVKTVFFWTEGNQQHFVISVNVSHGETILLYCQSLPPPPGDSFHSGSDEMLPNVQQPPAVLFHLVVLACCVHCGLRCIVQRLQCLVSTRRPSSRPAVLPGIWAINGSTAKAKNMKPVSFRFPVFSIVRNRR